MIAAVSRSPPAEAKRRQKSIQGVVWLLHPAGHGAVAKVAFAHRIAYGNVLDEWVWVCQGTLDQLAV